MSRMETKFFQHSYPRDTQPNRLDRLEKMVFGEAKTGSDSDRLAKLLEAVPAGSSSSSETAQSSGGTGGGSSSSSGSSSSNSSSGSDVADQPKSKGSTGRYTAPPTQTADNDDDVPVKTDEKYPAVTAIEQKILGKDYAGEPVDKRLARLETKEFGKPTSSSADLSDRVDALKQKTGIDVARMAPKGADWADDDDDIAVSPSARGGSRGPTSSSGYPREDTRSFSGRDLGQDFQKAFGTSNSGYGAGSSGGGSGSYGFGGGGGANSSAYLGGPSGSGSYGMGTGGGSTYPTSPPSYGGGGKGSQGGMGSPSGMGLNQQVSALEAEIFQKSWSHDPLPVRLNRLEATVFPTDKTLAEKSLPERVANLVAHVPISTPSSGRKVARANKDDDLDDLGSMNMNGMTGMGNLGGMSGIPTTSMSQAPQKSGGGGLGKIINSIGSMLSGGGNYGYTGGYPMSGGALATDPSTGMLYDPSSGNLIDPNTGAVVGRRAPVYNNYASGTGYGSPYGYAGGTGFNNGFSPYGGGMNRGFGPSFGFGSGGGMGMGGGMGGIRMGGIGGMWP